MQFKCVGRNEQLERDKINQIFQLYTKIFSKYTLDIDAKTENM